MPVSAAKSLAAVAWGRRWWALATFVAVMVVVVFAVSRMSDSYEATIYMLINPTHQSATSYEQTQASQALSTTFSELVGSQNLANTVKSRLHGDLEAELGNPAQHISAEAVPQSQLLKLIGTAGSPVAARLVVDTYGTALTELSESLAASGSVGGHASVAEPATTPTAPSGPDRKIYIVGGVLLAILAGLGVALVIDRFDRRLVIDDDHVEVLGLPIIGRVNNVTGFGIKQIAAGRSSDDPSTRAAWESFRLLLANIAFVNKGERPASVAIVSAGGRDGKTTCALGLTHAAAELGLSTLLVEADMRRPSLTTRLQISRNGGPGFSTVLVGQSTIEHATTSVSDSSAHFLPAGPLSHRPGALLASSALEIFEEEARGLYHLIVYDTPPLSVGADASLLAAHSEGAVLIIDAHHTNRRLALQAVEQLRRSGANILGIVINRAADVPLPAGY